MRQLSAIQDIGQPFPSITTGRALRDRVAGELYPGWSH